MNYFFIEFYKLTLSTKKETKEPSHHVNKNLIMDDNVYDSENSFHSDLIKFSDSSESSSSPQSINENKSLCVNDMNFSIDSEYERMMDKVFISNEDESQFIELRYSDSDESKSDLNNDESNNTAQDRVSCNLSKQMSKLDIEDENEISKICNEEVNSIYTINTSTCIKPESESDEIVSNASLISISDSEDSKYDNNEESNLNSHITETCRKRLNNFFDHIPEIDLIDDSVSETKENITDGEMNSKPYTLRERRTGVLFTKNFILQTYSYNYI